MIQVNELRIGSLALMLDYFTLNYIETTISDSDITSCVVNKCKNLQPILLTRDWLVKLGWRESDPQVYTKNEFSIELWHDLNHVFKWNGFVISIKLQHVHQLQNLYFTLTGEELTNC